MENRQRLFWLGFCADPSIFWASMRQNLQTGSPRGLMRHNLHGDGVTEMGGSICQWRAVGDVGMMFVYPHYTFCVSVAGSKSYGDEENEIAVCLAGRVAVLPFVNCPRTYSGHSPQQAPQPRILMFDQATTVRLSLPRLTQFVPSRWVCVVPLVVYVSIALPSPSLLHSSPLYNPLACHALSIQNQKIQKNCKNKGFCKLTVRQVLPRFELRSPESESDVITNYTIEPLFVDDARLSWDLRVEY